MLVTLRSEVNECEIDAHFLYGDVLAIASPLASDNIEGLWPYFKTASHGASIRAAVLVTLLSDDYESALDDDFFEIPFL